VRVVALPTGLSPPESTRTAVDLFLHMSARLYAYGLATPPPPLPRNIAKPPNPALLFRIQTSYPLFDRFDWNRHREIAGYPGVGDNLEDIPPFRGKTKRCDVIA
jgi:hypothetical protein